MIIVADGSPIVVDELCRQVDSTWARRSLRVPASIQYDDGRRQSP
jgi:hypothetical protein